MGGHLTPEILAKIFLLYKRKILSFCEAVVWRCDIWRCGNHLVIMRQELILTMTITEVRKIRDPHDTQNCLTKPRPPSYGLPILEATNTLYGLRQCGTSKNISSSQKYF